MKVEAAPSFFKSIKRIGSLKDKLLTLRGWIRYHIFNKNFHPLLKEVYHSYPWDEAFLYNLEKAKIHEMRVYHEKYRRFEGVEEVIRDMKICENLIDIFNGTKSLFHYDGELKFEPIDGSDNCEANFDDLKYNCDVYVNTKNWKRFIPNNKYASYWLEFPHELYIQKAKYLYHKIRYEKDAAWWD